MTPTITQLVPQFSFVISMLFLFVTVAPAFTQDAQPLSESLTLKLSLGEKAPDPACMQKHSALACTPLIVTVSNSADRGIGYVTSSCTHPRPFDFDFQSAAQQWQDILALRNINQMEPCSGNDVSWTVIPSHGSLTFPTTLAESFSPLAIDKVEKQLPLTIRVRWDGGACLAANEKEMEASPTTAFIHCAPNSFYKPVAPITSSSLSLSQPTQASR